MNLPRCHRVRNGLRALAMTARGAALVFTCTAVNVVAQSLVLVGPGVSSSQTPPPIPTLQSIHAAALAQDVTTTRIRRFLADKGSVVAVRELFETKGGTQPTARDLTFLGVEGEPAGSALSMEWSQTYSRFKMLLANSGVFAVRDLARAQNNYVLHDFGPVVRAARQARRLVVFPNSFDRAFWVIDVDDQTHALLYSAEFDAQLRLLSEVEVVAFSPTAKSISPSTACSYANFASARATMARVSGLIDPDIALVSGYALDCVHVRDDVLSGQQMMVSNFSDGIDQILVVQMPGTSDWLAGLPGTHKGAGVIGRRYKDPTMSVHMFWEGGVTFHVAGGGALVGLESLAKHLYVQALATH